MKKGNALKSITAVLLMAMLVVGGMFVGTLNPANAADDPNTVVENFHPTYAMGSDVKAQIVKDLAAKGVEVKDVDVSNIDKNTTGTISIKIKYLADGTTIGRMIEVTLDPKMDIPPVDNDEENPSDPGNANPIDPIKKDNSDEKIFAEAYFDFQLGTDVKAEIIKNLEKAGLQNVVLPNAGDFKNVGTYNVTVQYLHDKETKVKTVKVNVYDDQKAFDKKFEYELGTNVEEALKADLKAAGINVTKVDTQGQEFKTPGMYDIKGTYARGTKAVTRTVSVTILPKKVEDKYVLVKFLEGEHGTFVSPVGEGNAISLFKGVGALQVIDIPAVKAAEGFEFVGFNDGKETYTAAQLVGKTFDEDVTFKAEYREVKNDTPAVDPSEPSVEPEEPKTDNEVTPVTPTQPEKKPAATVEFE